MSEFAMSTKQNSVIPYEKIHSHLVDVLLPFWSERGLYGNGCFVEHFDMNGAPVDPGFIRVRVQARQIYVFSQAAQFGLYNSGAISARSADFLIRSAWLGADRGWAKLISRDGKVLEASSDLYDISFALFALAWAYRVHGDQRYLVIAHQTLDFLDREMRHPKGGFWNDAQHSFPRQQNPHMHLVEAMNAWADAAGDLRFIKLAAEILELFETRFLDAETGALGEFFDDDWSSISGPGGNIVEPGHQFEWAWIIGHYGRISGEVKHDLMQRLMSFGMNYGFRAEGGYTIDQVSRNGEPISLNRRLWPQTETVKACLAAREFVGTNYDDTIVAVINTIFSRFFDPAPMRAGWIDHYDQDWKPIVDKIPTSSLYHVALASFEVLRLKDEFRLDEQTSIQGGPMAGFA